MGPSSFTPAAGGNRGTNRAGRESLLAHSRAGGTRQKGKTMAEEFKPIETQEEFDAAIKARIERAQAKAAERFSDYDDLKARAEQADALRARVSELEGEASARAKVDEAETIRRKVSKATGVPAELIAGDDEEAMTASAEAIAAFARRPAAPDLGSAGAFSRLGGGTDPKGDFARAMGELFSK